MSKRLTPYGSANSTGIVAKVGNKGKTPLSLASRLPAELIAKVGTVTSTAGISLSPPEPFARIDFEGIIGARSRRVQRRSAYT